MSAHQALARQFRLAERLLQRAISKERSISTKTTATHIQRILTKLQVHSRAAAVALAYRLGLVHPRERSAAPVATGDSTHASR